MNNLAIIDGKFKLIIIRHVYEAEAGFSFMKLAFQGLEAGFGFGFLTFQKANFGFGFGFLTFLKAWILLITSVEFVSVVAFFMALVGCRHQYKIPIILKRPKCCLRVEIW